MCLQIVRRTRVEAKGLTEKRIQIVTSSAPGSYEVKIELYGGNIKYVRAGLLDSYQLMPSTAEARICDGNGHIIHTLRLPDSFVPYTKFIFNLEEPFDFEKVPVKGFLDNLTRIFWFGFWKKDMRSETDSIQLSPTTPSQRTDESSVPDAYSIDRTLSQPTDESSVPDARSIEVIDQDIYSSRSLCLNTEASSSFNSSGSPSKNTPDDQTACEARSKSFSLKPYWLIKITGTPK